MNRLLWYIVAHGMNKFRGWLLRQNWWERKVRKKYKGKRTEWLANVETRSWIYDFLCCSGFYCIPKGCDSRVLPLTEGARFTEAVAKCILARVQPVWIPPNLFLDQICAELYEKCGNDFSNSSWHLGIDEHGELCIHAHQPIDVTPPRPYRKRAKAVRFKFGKRAAQEAQQLGSVVDPF